MDRVCSNTIFFVLGNLQHRIDALMQEEQDKRGFAVTGALMCPELLCLAGVQSSVSIALHYISEQ